MSQWFTSPNSWGYHLQSKYLWNGVPPILWVPSFRSLAQGLFGADHPDGSAGGVHVNGHAPDAAAGLATELDEGGVVLLRMEEDLTKNGGLPRMEVSKMVGLKGKPPI